MLTEDPRLTRANGSWGCTLPETHPAPVEHPVLLPPRETSGSWLLLLKPLAPECEVLGPQAAGGLGGGQG